MKAKAIISILSVLLTGNVFAENVNVPFMHKAVPTEGLTISYDIKGTEKVVCATEDFYKGSVFITLNGVLKDTGVVYSDYDNQQFYFTSIGNDDVYGDIVQFHVDKRGTIKLADTHYKPHDSFASCWYASESIK